MGGRRSAGCRIVVEGVDSAQGITKYDASDDGTEEFGCLGITSMCLKALEGRNAIGYQMCYDVVRTTESGEGR